MATRKANPEQKIQDQAEYIAELERSPLIASAAWSEVIDEVDSEQGFALGV